MAVNINISNYEEFLLSAIDGELNGEELAALEAFLQQHPEVRKELSLLEATKLRPDMEMTFDAKASLYKKDDGLSATNYERFLLDYVDNELNASERTAVETLASQHPHIQKELTLLQASRLSPDLTVTFGNKASLYRKEGTRVRPLWWWSAAAAVVVGLAVWLMPGQRAGDATQVAVNQVNTKGTTANNSSSRQPSESQQANTPVVADADKPAGISPEAAVAEAVKPAMTDNGTRKTPVASVIAQNGTDSRASRRPASDAIANEPKQEEDIARIPDSKLPVLAKIPQPVSTSGEVVQQLQDKTAQQEKILAENIAVSEKTGIMANTEKINDAAAVASTAPANVKGELVVAVTMNGDSKLLNGVANVARFLSRKKK